MSENKYNKQVRIYGAGGHSQVINEVMVENGYQVTKIFDDKIKKIHYKSKNVVEGVRNREKKFPHDGDPVIIAVGINSDRAEISNYLECDYINAIHKSAIISPTSKIGIGTVIFAGAIVQPNTEIGDHVIINTSASIDHDNVIGNYAHISPKATLNGHVEIGEGTHVGAGAVVIPSIKIGKWCTIGAGTIVINDVPDYSTVVGNPGKIIKTIGDMTFIGSGISSSFTILHFLRDLEKQNYSGKKVNINIIEKYTEFFTGKPYGVRSGYSTLLITSLKDFLVEPELSMFKKWLNSNKIWLLDELKKEGGLLTENWLSTNKQAIKNNDWDDLFIPRRFFGCYLTKIIELKIKDLKSKELIEVNFIIGEVKDIEKTNDVFKLLLDNKRIIYSKKTILSVGSMPTNYLWKDKKLVQKPNLIFLNDPYNPSLGHVLRKTYNFFKNKPQKQTNVLIIGANASGLELMYKLNDINKSDVSSSYNFVFLSTQGKLPDGSIDEKRKKEFIPHNLLKLKNKDKLTAKTIAQATYADLEVADKIDLGAASTVDTISNAFGELLKKLNPVELEKFACLYGNNIGRQQRCAGNHYLNVISQLKKENRFEHIAGSFANLLKEEDQYYLNYLDTKTRKEKVYNTPFHIVINCIGSRKLTHKNVPSLLKNVMDKGYCKPNKSDLGFYVNNSLETIDNLHVLGPLLAGNVIENKAVWHVEHCGRIIWLSKLLGKILYNDIIVDTHKITELKTSYSLQINNLSTPSDKAKYKSLLKKEWNDNFFYTYCHIKHFEDNLSVLKYFLFKKNKSPLILMPLIFRKTPLSDDKNTYYDVATPYGYNGPLLGSSVSDDDLKEFWKSIDIWYKENNIVTEFIRFNLFENHKFYTGHLIPTLKNIIGSLTTFDNLWTNFKPKVRNNYRKAEKYNLKVEIYSQLKDEKIIADFYEIFLKTMMRKGAKNDYSFTKNYFQNLIEYYPDKIHIALVYKEDIPISTEFIIEIEDTLYSYLGGTLSDYFLFRPNDYLKIKVIKWALDNNKKYYVLGGGRDDYDSLYNYKKSFFPVDEDLMFYTGRKIINTDLYKAALKQNESEESLKNEDSDLNNTKLYFPLYNEYYHKTIDASEIIRLKQNN